MKSKKFLALTIIMSMVLSIALTACGDDAPEPTGNTGAAATEEYEEEYEDEEYEDEEYEEEYEDDVEVEAEPEEEDDEEEEDDGYGSGEDNNGTVYDYQAIYDDITLTYFGEVVNAAETIYIGYGISKDDTFGALYVHDSKNYVSVMGDATSRIEADAEYVTITDSITGKTLEFSITESDEGFIIVTISNFGNAGMVGAVMMEIEADVFVESFKQTVETKEAF